MKFKYMYLDESGDLGSNERSSKFIIISALVVDDYRELDRIIKNMRRNKFKKELSEKILILANDKRLRERKGLAGYDKFIKVENPEKGVLKHIELYKSVLKRDHALFSKTKK